jgi:hypothetical protein
VVSAGMGAGLPLGPSVGVGAAEPGAVEGLGAAVCACPREGCAGARIVGVGSVCAGSADGSAGTTGECLVTDAFHSFLF